MKRILFVLVLVASFGVSMNAQCEPPTLLWDEDGLIVNWIPKDNAVSHELQYREAGTFLWEKVEIPKYVSSFSLLSLERCLEYDIRVRTICEDEPSSYTSIFNAIPDCYTCYDEYCPPSSLFANNFHITKLTLNGVTQESTFNEDGSGYEDFRGPLDRVYSPGDKVDVEIEISENFGFENMVTLFIDYNRNLEFEAEETAIQLDFGDSDLTASGSFFIPESAFYGVNRLRVILSTFVNEVPSCNYTGFQGETEEYCILIQNLCDVDFAVELEGVEGDEAFFSWESLQIAQAYNVRYKKTSEPEEEWEELATIEPEITLDYLDECEEYEFEVRGVCPFDTSAYKNKIVFNSFCATSNKNTENFVNKISTSPNPWANDFQLTVNLKQASKLTIQLVNGNGQLMNHNVSLAASQGKNEIRISDFNEVPAGIYFIKVTDSSGVSSYHKTLKM